MFFTKLFIFWQLTIFFWKATVPCTKGSLHCIFFWQLINWMSLHCISWYLIIDNIENKYLHLIIKNPFDVLITNLRQLIWFSSYTRKWTHNMFVYFQWELWACKYQYGCLRKTKYQYHVFVPKLIDFTIGVSTIMAYHLTQFVICYIKCPVSNFNITLPAVKLIHKLYVAILSHIYFQFCWFEMNYFSNKKQSAKIYRVDLCNETQFIPITWHKGNNMTFPVKKSSQTMRNKCTWNKISNNIYLKILHWHCFLGFLFPFTESFSRKHLEV